MTPYFNTAFEGRPDRVASALLCAGDHVGLEGDVDAVYQIVHVSQQKAWVRPLRSGAQRIVETRNLRLILSSLGERQLAH